ncbi:ABC transporter permease subunit [Sulfurospirillum sp.]|nr:ABC transporter permease subunit [Sulfurospirillum sp.]
MRNSFFKGLFLFLSFVAMSLVYLLLLYVLYKGINSISLEMIFSDSDVLNAILLRERVFDGIFPAIVGTLMLIILSMSFAIVFGLSSGIYLSIYAKGRVKNFLNICFDILATVPSIIIGLFFLLLSIYLHKKYLDNFLPSLLLSSLALSLLILPYFVKNTQLSLEGIPKHIKLLGLSLGFNRMQNLIYILLPYCSKELLSGLFLALGRACEDTAVIMLTGAVASAGIATTIFAKYEALPFYIYYISSEYSNQTELNSAFGAALILLIIAISLFVLTNLLQKKIRKKYA